MAFLDLVFSFHITLQLQNICLDLPFVLFYLLSFEHPSILKQAII